MKSDTSAFENLFLPVVRQEISKFPNGQTRNHAIIEAGVVKGALGNRRLDKPITGSTGIFEIVLFDDANLCGLVGQPLNDLFADLA